MKAQPSRSPSPTSPSQDLEDYPGSPSLTPPASPTPTTSNLHDNDAPELLIMNLQANEVEVLEESLVEDDEGETDEGGTMPAKKRKRKASQVILSEETERQLGDWLEFDVPFFYNKGLPDYKNKAKQHAVLEEKGKSLDPPMTGQQLEQWLTTIRTRYGRLSKEKSGQGAVRLTEREKWILRTFSFLKPHITRQRNPRTLGFAQSASSAAAPPAAPAAAPPAAPAAAQPGPSSQPSDPATPDSIEEVTPAIDLPRKTPKAKPGAGIEKLIQDAAACRETLRDAVDAVKRDPEVEHWKGFLDNFAEEAAHLKGDFKQLLKVEVSSTMRRFLAAQRKGEEASESELLLYTLYNVNRPQPLQVAPTAAPLPAPQPAPLPSLSLAADPLPQHHQPTLTLTANQYATLTEALRPMCSSTPTPLHDLNISLPMATLLQGLFSPSRLASTTTAGNPPSSNGDKHL